MMSNRLSFLLGLIFITVITANIGLSNASKQFTVGESIGWQMPDENNKLIYKQWAEKNRFLVGDSLYFEYKNDSVLVANKEGYYHCNITNIKTTYTDGKTVIKLDKPGEVYFISGGQDHCKHGQRLLIDVMTSHPSTPPSPPSPSIAVPPQPPLPASPAPSPGHSSSGVSVVVSLISVLCALTISTTIVMLVM